MKVPQCPICNEPGQWVENSVVYGKRYGKSYMCYWCPKDRTYVGCHNNTAEPLGTMADQELRELRKSAHALFDPLWKSGKLTRRKAYKYLTEGLGEKKQVHIAWSDKEKCQRIIDFLQPTLL